MPNSRQFRAQSAILATRRTSARPMRMPLSMKLLTNPISPPSDRRPEKVNAPSFRTIPRDRTGPFNSERPKAAWRDRPYPGCAPPRPASIGASAAPVIVCRIVPLFFPMFFLPMTETPPFLFDTLTRPARPRQ